jgi:hypothetical protein
MRAETAKGGTIGDFRSHEERELLPLRSLTWRSARTFAEDQPSPVLSTAGAHE